MNVEHVRAGSRRAFQRIQDSDAFHVSSLQWPIRSLAYLEHSRSTSSGGADDNIRIVVLVYSDQAYKLGLIPNFTYQLQTSDLADVQSSLGDHLQSLHTKWSHMSSTRDQREQMA